MKRILSLLALSLLWPLPAFAALSVVTGNTIQGSPYTGLSLSASVPANSEIVVLYQGGTAPPTISDSINGSYTSMLFNATSALGMMVVKTTASGNPTITITGTSGYTYLSVMAITGFSGTPTVDTSIQNNATGSGTTATINATSGHNNEVLLVGQNVNNYVSGVTVSGYSPAVSGNTNQTGFYAIETTSGTVNNFSGTFTPSGTWYLQLAGIYDSGSAAKPSAFFLAM